MPLQVSLVSNFYLYILHHNVLIVRQLALKNRKRKGGKNKKNKREIVKTIETVKTNSRESADAKR